MFTKIKEFFLGKPAPEAQAPYKVESTHVEVAPVTAPIVAAPVVQTKQPPAKKPAAMKATVKPKKQQFDKN